MPFSILPSSSFNDVLYHDEMIWERRNGWRLPAARAGMQNRHEKHWLLRKRAKKVLAIPALPPALANSTIGARGLNDRVRDGNGCFPSAVIARMEIIPHA